MAAGAWVVTNAIKERIGNAEVNFDTDTFKVRLYSSTSNLAATSDDATAVTNELSTANGYTAGGAAVTPTWTRSTGTATFDVSDPSWTASGGSIVARFAAIVDETPTPDRVVAYCLLDNTPADVTTTTGNTLTIQISASGVFTLT
jgi:hypothetical protein